ncbi:protein IL-40 [Ornithorhynchus anatinus]|uniref:protein IL-40 n=1 Tax=Ornithorhynchus anatinus TaxID=9258 RepID=UPI0010A8A209|nr:protein IL-40 [Ornithorhynchus anatinus]
MEVLLLCLTASGTPSQPHISYEVLKTEPGHRLVRISCRSSRGALPINYFLVGGLMVTATNKTVARPVPAFFQVRVSLKSRPDLLTYRCRAVGPSGQEALSSPLQLYWELWVKSGVRVSQPQANFTLVGEGSPPRVEVLCQASEGTPPITYRLLGQDGHVLFEKTPPLGTPANFSLPMAQMSGRYRCQAENVFGAQYSAVKLVPPGELPRAPVYLLSGSLVSIFSTSLGVILWTRVRGTR